MAIQFIIDSACDILPDEAKALGMVHLPLTIRFGEEEFEDSVTITHEQFFQKLVESRDLPATAQVSPAAFEAAYRDALDAGNEVIAITISSKLSGTWQSAMIAAEGLEGKVFVVDSENATVGERILILRALQLRDEGLSAAEIVKRLNEEKHRIKLYALLDTLEFLKRGGRISATTAVIGGILSIKPIVTIQDGVVSMANKARGTKNGYHMLSDMVKQSGGIDRARPYALAYSGLNSGVMTKYLEGSADLWKQQDGSIPYSTVGCTIGTHVGPGAIIVAYFGA